jgi:hypothetical protein
MKEIEIKIVSGQIIRKANMVTASDIPLDSHSEGQLNEVLNHLNGANQMLDHLVSYLQAKQSRKKKLEETDPAILILRPEDRVNDNVRRGGTDHWPLRS